MTQEMIAAAENAIADEVICLIRATGRADLADVRETAVADDESVVFYAAFLTREDAGWLQGLCEGVTQRVGGEA